MAVNPNDTEEAIWAFVCEARTLGPEAARVQFLRVGVDSRPVMRAAYDAFLTGSGPDKVRCALERYNEDTQIRLGCGLQCTWMRWRHLIQEVTTRTSLQIQAAISEPGSHSDFYGKLYIGLYHEAHGGLQEPAARAAIEAACATQYARLSGDYMASLARVHCKRRGWDVPSA